MKKTNLILGTAQFGSKYGVTNKNGQVSLETAMKIFDFCKANNINYLDSAQSYGNSEKIIGKALNKKNDFKIFSKIKKIKNKFIRKKDIENLENEFYSSCKNLGLEKIYGLFIHSINDIKKGNNSLIYDWLENLKERNLIQKIGISIYDPEDLEGINLKKIDIVQIPFNLYNQEFLTTKSILKIKNENCKIQVRSIYLQGLLINSYLNWPSWINKEHIDHHKRLLEYCNNINYSLLDLNLCFLKSFEFIDDLIIGISSLKEIKQFKKSWDRNLKLENFDYKLWNIENKDFNDPRRWPS